MMLLAIRSHGGLLPLDWLVTPHVASARVAHPASDVGCMPRARLACDERLRTVLSPTTHPIAPYPRARSK
jgi:hypothetical protein